LVAVFLLPVGGQSGVRSQIPDRNEARLARGIESCRPLCHRSGRRRAEAGHGSFTLRYDYALQAMRELPYDKWREYDAEDTVRFYALRMHEAGFIKSTPQKIIADGTDWHFLNELKRELKA
jgi:NitT/TauT family transport system substrate-binding protein